jgi:hypothetical protein
LHETEHFVDRALVRVGILAQIERGEMKAEGIDGSAQILQAALGQDRRAVGDERAVEDRKIGDQLVTTAIGWSVADGMLRGFETIEHPRRRRQPRVDPGNRPPVWGSSCRLAERSGDRAASSSSLSEMPTSRLSSDSSPPSRCSSSR